MVGQCAILLTEGSKGLPNRRDTMTTYTITDNFTKEIVATRKTENAAKKWAKGLNEGLALFNGVVRYSVSKVMEVV